MLGTTMDRTKLQALATELAKDIKTEADLNALSRELLKLTVETALSAELTDHLGYEKHGDSRPAGGNARNCTMSKRLKSQHGEVQIQTPRDREGSFEPQLLRKNQTRLTQMDDQILTLYAKGLTTREIVDAFKEMYDADVSAALISKVTDRVIEQITAWQSRPLDAMYPVVYLDCMVVKIRDGMRVMNKAIYLALGVNMDGHKDLLGLWMSDNEGACKNRRCLRAAASLEHHTPGPHHPYRSLTRPQFMDRLHFRGIHADNYTYQSVHLIRQAFP